MIRFTWLRFRAQAAVVFGALAVLAVVLAVTGWHLARLYDTTAAACKARGDCAAAMNAFASSDSSLQSFVKLVLLAAPALIGMFWGRPCSPVNSKPAPSASRGPRTSPPPAGWPPN